MRYVLIWVGLMVALGWGEVRAQVEPEGQWDSVAALFPRLSVHYAGSALRLPKSVFGNWLPQGLGGQSQTHVEVLPLSDSVSLHMDTSSAWPAYLLCQYSGSDSTALVLLERSGHEYIGHWRSCRFIGPGRISFKDLNLDGQPEIISTSYPGLHANPSVFIWQWAGDSLVNITPGGCTNISRLCCGSVTFDATDSGTVIKRSFRMGSVGSTSTYFLAKGDSVIRAVKDSVEK